MFSLIITIISIALVAALALATLYYGGDAYNQGRADAQASKVLNQGQQLLAAAEVYYVKEGSWPLDFEDMVDAGYLKSIPVAQAPGQAMGNALANGTPWTMPAPGQPVFVLPGVDTPTCQRVNKRTYDLDGILPQAHTALAAQCYGVGPSTFNVVVAKSGAALGPAGAVDSAVLPAADVTSDPIPDAADLGAWTVPPGTDVAAGPGDPIGGPGGPIGGPGDPWGGPGGGSTPPMYCVSGVTFPGETSCSAYRDAWMPEIAEYEQLVAEGGATALQRVSYTVTVDNVGTMTGIPITGDANLNLRWRADDSDPGIYLTSSWHYNTVTGNRVAMDTISEGLSSYTSGYFELVYANAHAWNEPLPGTLASAWRTLSVDYPLAPFSYDSVTVRPRWAASGQSSLQFCLTFDISSDPSNIDGPYMSADAIGTRVGACN